MMVAVVALLCGYNEVLLVVPPLLPTSLVIPACVSYIAVLPQYPLEIRSSSNFEPVSSYDSQFPGSKDFCTRQIHFVVLVYSKYTGHTKGMVLQGRSQ